MSRNHVNAGGRRARWLIAVVGVATLATQALAVDLSVPRTRHGESARHQFNRAALMAEQSALPAQPIALPHTLVGSPVCGLAGPNYDDARAVNAWDDGTGFVSYLYYTPADPHGAVGPDHLLFTINGAIAAATKDGTVVGFQRLGADGGGSFTGSFFEPVSLLRNRYDPHARVVYDEYSNRFVVMTLELTLDDYEIALGNQSAICVAVSDDSDPTGTWYFHRIPTLLTIGGTLHHAIQPAIAVGPDAIYITADFLDFDNGSTQDASRFFVVKKDPFYAGQPAVVNMYNPTAEAGLELDPALPDVVGLVPVQPYGAIPGAARIFLVSTSSGYTIGGDEIIFIIKVNDPAGAITFGAADDTSVALSITEGSDYTNGFQAPQQGSATQLQTFTNTISGYYGGIEGTAWRDDKLWIVNTRSPSSGTNAGQVTVSWIKFDTSEEDFPTNYFQVLDQGDVGGEDIAAGASTFAPAIAVNAAGDMAISFTASSSSMFPSAYYTGRRASDPVGTVAPAQLLAAGTSYYNRLKFGAVFWGFGSTVAVDPTAPNAFWTYNAYPIELYVDNLGNWATQWASFSLVSVPADLDFDGLVNAADLALLVPCMSENGGVPYVPNALPAGCSFTADCAGRILPDFNRDGAVDMLDFAIWQENNGLVP